MPAKQLKHFTAVDLTCYEKLANESDDSEDERYSNLSVEINDNSSMVMSTQVDKRSCDSNDSKVDDIRQKTAAVKFSPIAKKSPTGFRFSRGENKGTSRFGSIDSPTRSGRASPKKIVKKMAKFDLRGRLSPSREALVFGGTMFREQRDPAKVVWTPVNDELLLSRVKRFAGRIYRRERGWAIIAEPFHPGMSVAAVTTRAHKVLKLRNMSIDQLVADGFGNE
ncbi:hypothetical protein TL16_g09828 [Triparma laevis f. inornata]|uniref:Uncharacterized protein n=2 Tax=Triparma laevis TaxID=1534972 RepID=A0A9W7FDC2_9STRA|nr:hypothetical protein TL16_g09828 [Triparma laevis f. inornata]GMI10090.1 hypothetical protein TrLO_g2342 [Triparma laevis f. longispina]